MRETVSKSIDSQIIFQSGSSFHLGEKMHEDGFLDVSKRMMNSVGFFKLSTCAIFSWTCLCLCLKAFMLAVCPVQIGASARVCNGSDQTSTENVDKSEAVLIHLKESDVHSFRLSFLYPFRSARLQY